MSDFLVVHRNQVARLLGRIGTGSDKLVRVQILSKVKSGEWVGIVSGQKVRLRSDLTLKIGSVYACKMQQTRSRVFFKIIESPPPITGQTNESKLSGDDAKITRALLNAGLPVTNNRLALAQGLIRKVSDKDLALRVMSLIMAKGLRPSTELVQYFIQVIEGRWNSDRQKERRESGHQGTGEEDGQVTVQHEDADTNDLGDSKFSFFSQSDQNLLACCNHIVAPHGNWIIIPFDVRGVTGRLILRTDSGNETPEKCILYVDIESGKMLFILRSLEDGSMMLRIACDSVAFRKLIRRYLHVLREKLRNSAVKIDDTIYDSREFDQFGGKIKDEIVRIDQQI